MLKPGLPAPGFAPIVWTPKGGPNHEQDTRGSVWRNPHRRVLVGAGTKSRKQFHLRLRTDGEDRLALAASPNAAVLGELSESFGRSAQVLIGLAKPAVTP